MSNSIILEVAPTEIVLAPRSAQVILSTASVADQLVGVSSADTTAEFLDDKLVVGSGIAKVIVNPGASETLQLSVAPSEISHIAIDDIGTNSHAQIDTALAAGITKVGTPVDNEIAVWTGDGTIEGDPDFTWSGDQFRVVWQDPGSLLNNTGTLMLNDTSVLNPDGWQSVPGSPGLFDGELLWAADPSDTVNTLRMRMMPANAVIFTLGAAVNENNSFRSEAAGALAFFMPQDTTGREETKISFVGEVGGTGHEGVFSIEGFAYGDAGLQFHRLAHFVIDSDYTLRAEMLGNLSVLAGYIQPQLVTDARLDDITDVINTAKGKIQGAQVFNSSQNVPVWAVGNADGSVWVDGAGTTINTPV